MVGGWWDGFLRLPQGEAWLIAWIIWVVLAITLHELAHGWTALRLGDPTPELTGHMTWNPLVHMGLFGVAMLIFTGCSMGAMPVDSTRLRGRHAETLVALAGPAVNVVLFVLCVLGVAAAKKWAPAGQVWDRVEIFLFVGAALNAVLVMLNLLPVYPLDGGRVAVNYVRPYRSLVEGENGVMWTLTLTAIVFVVASNLGLLVVGVRLTDAAVRLIT